jgi:two-component system NarL family sensor kinase
MSAVRILLADDHAIVRRGLRALLSARPDWFICGEAEDGFDAIEKAKQLTPDVILMDVSMPRLNGLEAARAIRLQVPEAQILIVSQNDPAVLRAQASDVGARGYVAKADLSRDLLNTIDRVVAAQPPAGTLNHHDSAGALLLADVDAKDAPDLTWLNRRLRDLLMQAPSAIGITSGPLHRWEYVNIARAKMAGRAGIEDFVGKEVRASYPELVGQPFFAALDQVYRTGVPFIGREVKGSFNRGPDGAPDEVYLDCVYQPIRSPSGEVEGILIHTVEVTEQVLARRALELANEREKQQRAAVEFERNQLRELFRQAPAGIGILAGPDHRWSFANSAYCEILGRPLETLRNRPIRETLPELDGQGFFELLDKVYETGTPYIGKDMKAVIRRGPDQLPQEAYFDFIYQPVRNIAGEIQGLMVLAVEVTQQLQARSQLESRVQERTLELRRAHEALRALSGRLMQAQDEERRRVARELHDSAGQYLAAIQMNLSALAGDSSQLAEGLRSRLEDSMDLVRRCTSEIRTLSYLLHPPLLDDMGLASAISWYVDGFSERSGVAVSLDIPKNLARFSPEVETALFRIVQQSLANIHRHSDSKVARIRLALAGERLTVEISDEGRGLAPEILSKFRQSGQLPGVGISGMRERINGMHGTFDITSSPSGTTIAVTLPIAQHS